MEEVDVTIGLTGEVSLTVRGVAGASCLDLTRDLEQRLGTVEAREHTAAFYQVAEQQQQQWNLGG
ncbi:MAG: DUF2997 domain-containing protein [Candidatus Sericytochromatia bacterium]|nr:DUF2997 domain-containing protein [Candidatus Sericytochromatia bacterium]